MLCQMIMVLNQGEIIVSENHSEVKLNFDCSRMYGLMLLLTSIHWGNKMGSFFLCIDPFLPPYLSTGRCLKRSQTLQQCDKMNRCDKMNVSDSPGFLLIIQLLGWSDLQHFWCLRIIKESLGFFLSFLLSVLKTRYVLVCISRLQMNFCM